ncbi:MAG: hypothetical protein JO257_20255 [Deltaproteobacteria bacterium]|nr:hypothetical protein [Deltaproteobacteria bacterium]
MSRAGWVIVALLVSACGKKDAANPAGSTAPVGSGSAVVAGSAATVAAPADPKAALDAALKAKGVPAKDVVKRVDAAHTSWALVVSKSRDDASYVMQYSVMRAGADGVGEVAIDARTGGDQPALGKDIDAFDVRDLDGDGSEECVAVIAWQLDHTFPYDKGCKKCEYGQGEGGKQLYVIGDKAGKPAIAFTHLVEYTTLSQPGEATNPDPPAEEKVAYDWKVDGPPPHVTLTRTDNQLNPKRHKELLDPATDPLLAAGSGKDVPLVLK